MGNRAGNNRRAPDEAHQQSPPAALSTERGSAPIAAPAPIAALSSDLLACVFAFIPLPPRLRCISLVCKRWRAAALRSVSELRLPWMQLDALRILPAVREVYCHDALIESPLRTALRDLTRLHCSFDCLAHGQPLHELLAASAATLTALSLSFPSSLPINPPPPPAWPTLSLPALADLTVKFDSPKSTRLASLAVSSALESLLSLHSTQLTRLTVLPLCENTAPTLPGLWPLISKFPYPRLRVLAPFDVAALAHFAQLLTAMPAVRLSHNLLAELNGHLAPQVLARTTELVTQLTDVSAQMERIALCTNARTLVAIFHSASLIPPALQHSSFGLITRLVVSFSLSGGSLTDLLSQLGPRCPRLASLMIYNAAPPPPPASPLAPMPSLLSLSYSAANPVNNDPRTHVRCLLHALPALPSLRHLHFSLPPDPNSKAALSPAFFAAVAKLTTLEGLYVHPFTEAMRQRVAAQYPALVTWHMWSSTRLARYL